MPYTVMTRENTNSLLEDMGLDPKVCAAEANCEVDFGRNINAALVVSGMVVSIEGELMLTLKLYETRGGTLLAPTRITAANQRVLIGKASSATAAMVREGLGLETPRRQARVEADQDLGGASSFSFDESKDFLVKFNSTPEGAAVSLDGSYLCDTPCSRELGGGSYRLEVAKARYDRHEESLEITGKRSVSVDLVPQFGWLTVETTPSGLDITIDGKPSGKSPLRRLEFPPGSHEVMIGDSRWQPTGRKVSVSKGSEKTVSLQAAPREGGLVVSAVDGAGNALDLPVSIDGEKAGETPLKKKLQVGEYTVVVGDKTHRVQIRENEVEELEVTEKQESSVYATPNTGRDNAGKNPHLWQSVSAGENHTCGVKTSGSVECWGQNNERGVATPPSGTFQSVSAGNEHTCGVTSAGSVECWGQDAYGMSTPPSGTFESVSAGAFHTCGVTSSGSVACWGSVPPSGTFQSVSTGYAHTCGVKTDGSVECWGNDDNGSIHDGDRVSDAP